VDGSKNGQTGKRIKKPAMLLASFFFHLLNQNELK